MEINPLPASLETWPGWFEFYTQNIRDANAAYKEIPLQENKASQK